MKTFNLLALVGFASAQAKDASCPPLPKGVQMGKGIPPNPAHIPTGCSPLEVLIARGTSEPNYEAKGGKFGIIVGDPLISNLTLVLPEARGYPVQYPASSDLVGGVQIGAKDVLARLKSQSTACPNAKFALVGYSQGARVIRGAADGVTPDLEKKIVAVVLYGDRTIKTTNTIGGNLASKLLVSCAVGDATCDSGTCFFWHLNYIRQPWVDKSVKFIVDAFNGRAPAAITTGVGLRNDGKFGNATAGVR